MSSYQLFENSLSQSLHLNYRLMSTNVPTPHVSVQFLFQSTCMSALYNIPQQWNSHVNEVLYKKLLLSPPSILNLFLIIPDVPYFHARTVRWATAAYSPPPLPSGFVHQANPKVYLLPSQKSFYPGIISAAFSGLFLNKKKKTTDMHVRAVYPHSSNTAPPNFICHFLWKHLAMETSLATAIQLNTEVVSKRSTLFFSFFLNL